MFQGRILDSLLVEHDWKLLIVGGCVAALAIFISLRILARSCKLAAHLRPLLWILAGCAAGGGIWASQIIALLGYEPFSHSSLDPEDVGLSLALCVTLVTLGFSIAMLEPARMRILSGFAIASGTCMSQFLNFQAFHGPTTMVWNAEWRAITFGLCLLLSCYAFNVQSQPAGLNARWRVLIILLASVATAYASNFAAILPLLPSTQPSLGSAVLHENAALNVAFAVTVLLVLIKLMAVTVASLQPNGSSQIKPRNKTTELVGLRLSQAYSGLALLARSPIIGFALTLIVVIWAAALWHHGTEREADLIDVANDADNMSRIIGQNVERTATNLDTTLKYIRRSYERSGYVGPWASFVSDEYTNNSLTVQIAAIDVHGTMITSSAMLYPEKKIDLSDREHFVALRGASGDPLFISRPMTGRASNKMSVQFARRIFNKNREFDGILVASLTTDYLVTSFGNSTLSTGSGITLFGEDGIIRAGLGVYGNSLGKPIREVSVEGFENRLEGYSQGLVTSSTGIAAVATRPIVGYPLSVRVVLKDQAGILKRETRWMLYVIGLSIATILIIYVAATLFYNHHIFQAKIVRLAHYDVLTDIPNRTKFNTTVDRAFAKRDDSGFFALILIDLDDFKYVNDTHGHPLGDQLLKAAAARLRNSLRKRDEIARLGGDEFAVLQTNMNTIADAVALASRLCRILSEPFEIDGFTVSVGASIGIATSKDACDGRTLLKAADLALYEAKAAGRGTYKLFDSQIGAAFDDRRRLEQDLRIALEKEQFVLYYQPIINIQSGATTGYEALVRWQHPERGLVAPGNFMDVAEESGLILPLGKWIINQACNDIIGCAPGLTVAVNCSALQFKSVDFVDIVMTALESSGLPANHLVLEITESILMSKDQATLARLETLRQLGVGLSLDDFGTGFSSLSYVMRYPFSILKIDRSFTSQLCEDIRGASVVKAICALAGSLDMKAVAEGVETPEQLEALRLLGCGYAQGYFFSRPKPADEILMKVPRSNHPAAIKSQLDLSAAAA